MTRQVSAPAALTVKKMIQEGKNPITAGDFKWIFAFNSSGI